MANARDLLLTSLRRPELDTQSRTREALVIIGKINKIMIEIFCNIILLF